MEKVEFFKFTLLLVYLILIIILVAAIAFSSKTRAFLIKIHKSPTDEASWLRYGLSVILIVALGIAIHNATYSDKIDHVVVWMLGVAIAGKVTASGINKDK